MDDIKLAILAHFVAVLKSAIQCVDIEQENWPVEGYLMYYVKWLIQSSNHAIFKSLMSISGLSFIKYSDIFQNYLTHH